MTEKELDSKDSNIVVERHDMLIFISSEVRYSLGRDNHLAPKTSVDLVKKYLPRFKEERWKTSLIDILISDIEADLRMHDRKYRSTWLELLAYLKTFNVSNNK